MGVAEMTTATERSLLIPPCGGTLVNLVVTGEERDNPLRKAKGLPSTQLSARSCCDLELLATGAFSPLERFMGLQDYQRVLDEMRGAGGWGVPVPGTLSVEPGPAARPG